MIAGQELCGFFGTPGEVIAEFPIDVAVSHPHVFGFAGVLAEEVQHVRRALVSTATKRRSLSPVGGVMPTVFQISAPRTPAGLALGVGRGDVEVMLCAADVCWPQRGRSGREVCSDITPIRVRLA